MKLPGNNLIIFFHVIHLELEIVCHSDYIEVTVESKNYPGLDTNITHLEDETCAPRYKDESKAVFRFGLEECKTQQEDDGKVIHYKNRIIAVVKDVEDEEHITRKSTRILPFQCAYEKKVVLSKVSYSPGYKQLITNAGTYTTHLVVIRDRAIITWKLKGGGGRGWETRGGIGESHDEREGLDVKFNTFREWGIIFYQ